MDLVLNICKILLQNRDYEYVLVVKQKVYLLLVIKLI